MTMRISVVTVPYLWYVVHCLLFITTVYAAPLEPESVRELLPEFTAGKLVTGNIVRVYHERYGLDSAGVTPVMGTFTSDSFTCVGQWYRSDCARGTVFFLHGYLDHTGTIANGIKACLEAGWSVAVMDLPGHGLSSGERGAINDFSEYVRAFRTFYLMSESHLQRPFVFIGHSTGCAVGLEYLRNYPDQQFPAMILIAPLLRGDFYYLSRLGNVVLRPFVKTTFRWFRRASHDRTFLKEFRDDPLQTKRFPVRWANAYYQWYDQIMEYDGWKQPVVIIQGTGDRVVEWRYNLPWLQRHLQNCTIVRIEGARHQLLNETADYRSACIEAIQKVLCSNSMR